LQRPRSPLVGAIDLRHSRGNVMGFLAVEGYPRRGAGPRLSESIPRCKGQFWG